MDRGITINKIFAYIIAFFLLLDGSNMWQLTGSINLATNSVRTILLVVSLMCVIATLSVRRVQISYRFLSNMTAVSILFFMLWLATRYNFIYFFRIQYVMFMVFTLYVYVLMRYGLIMDFVKAFINLWLIITIVTTVIWFFTSIVNVIPLTPTRYYWINQYLPSYTFHRLYYANPVQNTNLFGINLFRNTGLYAEAPGTSGYYLYAIGTELAFLVKDKGHKRRLTIFVIGALTTLSTKAVLYVPVILFLAYLFREKDNQTAAVLQFVKVMLTLIIISVIGVFIYQTLIEKSTTGSFGIRSDDVMAAMKVFKDNPIFGIGLGNLDPILSNTTVHRNNNGLSMGLFLMLAQGGLWMTAMYLFPFFAMIKRFIGSDKTRRFILMGVTVVWNLIISNIVGAPSFVFLVAAGYAYFTLTETEKQNLLHNNFE